MKEEYQYLEKPGLTAEESIGRLKNIISVLRAECPWDRKQNHDSLRNCMLEEAYEVVEAIEKGDMDNLEEELGDVALQVVFHANLGEESGNFDLTSVLNRECEKMIRRHPHVFLEESANNDIKSIDKVLEKWENIKAKEKQSTSRTDVLAGVPKALPALTRAAKIQKKAAEVGFDWNDVSGAFNKIKEETGELSEAYLCGDRQEHILEELGDLLFSTVNAARFLKVDPEEALRFATEKFIKRFGYIERESLACGRRLEDMTIEEMDELWEQAKKSGKNIG